MADRRLLNLGNRSRFSGAWDEFTIAAAISDYFDEVGHETSMNQVCRVGGLPSQHTIINIFGSWSDCLQIIRLYRKKKHLKTLPSADGR